MFVDVVSMLMINLIGFFELGDGCLQGGWLP